MASRGGTSGLLGPARKRRTLPSMENQPHAEEMPELYRAVLDTVWRLERAGEREAAFEIRRRAVHAYATHWGERGRRELIKINRDAQRRLARSPGGALIALEAVEAR